MDSAKNLKGVFGRGLLVWIISILFAYAVSLLFKSLGASDLVTGFCSGSVFMIMIYELEKYFKLV